MILKSGSCLSLRPLSPFRLSLLVYSPTPFWVEYRVKMFRVKFTIPTGIFLCVKWSLKTGFAYKFWRFRWTKECVGEDFVFRRSGSGQRAVEGGRRRGRGSFCLSTRKSAGPSCPTPCPGQNGRGSHRTGLPRQRRRGNTSTIRSSRGGSGGGGKLGWEL